MSKKSYVFKVWEKFASRDNWLIVRSFTLRKYADDLIRYRITKDKERGDDIEYVITVDDESPTDIANDFGIWSPDEIYSKRGKM